MITTRCLFTLFSHFQADAWFYAGDNVPVNVDFQHGHNGDDGSDYWESCEYPDGCPGPPVMIGRKAGEWVAQFRPVNTGGSRGGGGTRGSCPPLDMKSGEYWHIACYKTKI